MNIEISAWRLSVSSTCMFCGGDGGWIGLQVHHIQRRSGAQKSPRIHAGFNLLLLCESCHAGPFATMPHAKQLRLKMEVDFEHYNLREWLRIADPELRAPNRITQEEVDAVDLGSYLIQKGGLQF